MYGQESRFAKNPNKQVKSTAKTMLRSLKNEYEKLTPAGQYMVKVLLKLANQNHGTLTRQDIAQALGRPKELSSHDRLLLKQLEGKFITSKRKNRPMKNNYPTGYIIVYEMNQDIAWLLNRSHQNTKQNTGKNTN